MTWWRKMLAVILSGLPVVAVLAVCWWVGQELERIDDRLVTDWWPDE